MGILAAYCNLFRGQQVGHHRGTIFTMETLSILCLAIAVAFVSAAEWSYETKADNGPANWNKKFSKCLGRQQSPIDIKMNEIVYDENLKAFDRSIFTKPFQQLSAENNGHALAVTVNHGAYQIDHEGVLPGGKYELAQFHFHWGSNPTSAGSEHTVDGKQYFGELHLVHYNTKYENISVAVDKPDGLAVLGIFIEANYPQDNLQFTRMMDLLENVHDPGYKKTLTPAQMFSMETLLPCDISMYCRYQGSLTTPTCDESVTWTVFTDTLKISPQQATTFANSLNIKYGNKTSILKDNFRPIQPLNGRVVYSPPKWVRESSSAGQTISTVILQLSMAALVFFSTRH